MWTPTSLPYRPAPARRLRHSAGQSKPSRPAPSSRSATECPPTSTWDGLAYFAAAKNHCAIYGLSTVLRAHQPDLAVHDTSKGTIRFPPAEPLPEALIQTLIKARIEEIEAADAERKKPNAGP
jgi:hypothetical protein